MLLGKRPPSDKGTLPKGGTRLWSQPRLRPSICDRPALVRQMGKAKATHGQGPMGRSGSSQVKGSNNSSLEARVKGSPKGGKTGPLTQPRLTTQGQLQACLHTFDPRSQHARSVQQEHQGPLRDLCGHKGRNQATVAASRPGRLLRKPGQPLKPNVPRKASRTQPHGSITLTKL
ncbi:hypothetical protein P7K49_024820 [Saguinus oedipus]|uniref:Uncharacterized protein n=1 Tax=Saguinus oedipus TaxID=9490 RepID=A0ABQ9URE1_SAGOE|nr:hypothetical protein P7K49_024820 [Saguinus oedipus]